MEYVVEDHHEPGHHLEAPCPACQVKPSNLKILNLIIASVVFGDQNSQHNVFCEDEEVEETLSDE